jgi:hypothetical protein
VFGTHESPVNKSDTWLTPPHIVEALGPFDTDPCCPPSMPWRTAAVQYTKEDDGLAQPWKGRVWLNPPYSREAVKWLRKMAAHGRGTSLTFARTETAWFIETIWNAADAVLFLHGRLSFCDVTGKPAAANGGAPSVLAAYGAEDVKRLEMSGLKGTFLRLPRDYLA